MQMILFMGKDLNHPALNAYVFYIFHVIDLNASPVLFPGTKFS